MAFDLENAVQQGFNRDPVTNDWHVEARNLDIKLDDHGGVREFRILDDENVGVVVADSDGYLSIAGNAEVHGGHVLIRGESLTNTEYVTLQDQTDEVSLHLFDLNPDNTISGEMGSFGTNMNDGYMYVNVDGSQQWERLAMVSQIPNLEENLVTFTEAVTNDPLTDITAAEAETLTDASNADALHSHAYSPTGHAHTHASTTGQGTDDHHAKSHSHDGIDGSGTVAHSDTTGQGTDDHHSESHTIVSHSDTSATGPELDELTDGSTTVLHNHSVGVSTTTLHEAYKNDTDDDAATIHTDTVDGPVIFAGSERLWVNATGGFDLDAPFDMDGYSGNNFTVDLTSGSFSFDVDAASNLTVDGANLTLETTTSGDVLINIPDGTGDFIVDDAGGSRYIRASSSNGELELGDPDVFTTVLDDMEIIGNLTVQGTTTTINTQELMVEDRLVRLNTGSPSNFSDNVGIEAEVGSDGYVEFHWDDTQGRWELSIDRSTTPEAQTFRPLAYLADSPATLDLSSTGDDGWPTAGPNPSAGASVINTNQTNYPYTFGPDMTDDSVQAALEAIDGYFIEITQSIGDAEIVTLQEAYKNDDDGSDATITTDAIDGDVIITGTEMFQVTADEGMSVNTSGVIDLEADGVIEIDGYADSHFIVKDGDLWLATDRVNGTTGDVNIDSAEELNVTTGTDIFVQAGVDGVSGKIAIQATDDSLFYVDTADLTLQTGQTGDIKIDSGDSVVVDADVNIDMEATQAVEIDGYADSHFIADGGELVLATTTTGSVHIDGVDGISLDGNGNDVLPAVSCQDNLGDASHAWLDIFLCDGSNNPIPLGGPGGPDAPNSTSGAYVVGTNSDNFITFGPDMTTNTVQAALEAIDGYLSDIVSGDIEAGYFKQVRGLDINGAVLNGVVKVATDAGTPALDFKKDQTSRASWSLPVPADWDGLSDIVVEVVWSPDSTDTGDVEWRLEYKALTLTELSSSAATPVDYTETAGGTADAIQTTGVELAIPGSALTEADEILVINLVRRGSAAGDTFLDYAQVHLVKYSYTAENIV